MKQSFIDVWNWVISNFSKLLSIIGLISTVYFAAFYVPDYVEDSAYNKSLVAKQELLSEIGEILFNGKTIKVNEINDLISGKELFYKITFPYNSKELLTLLENEIRKNRYISLEKRITINGKIKNIRNNIKTKPNISKNNKSDLFTSLFGFLIALLAFLAGIVSIYFREKKDKEINVDLNDEELPFESGSTSARGYEYSEMVSCVLKELNVEIKKELKPSPQQPVYGPEFKIKSSNGNNYVIETKAYRRKVGVGTIRNFIHYVDKVGEKGILVITSSLTVRAKELVFKYNYEYKEKMIQVVTGVTKGEISSSLKLIFDE